MYASLPYHCIFLIHSEPLFRNVILLSGYMEEWGMYAERLAWELGLYEDNPYGNIWRLQLELLRAVYMVVDTEIHAKKWTRDRAKQYMKDIFGSDMYSYMVDRFILSHNNQKLLKRTVTNLFIIELGVE